MRCSAAVLPLLSRSRQGGPSACAIPGLENSKFHIEFFELIRLAHCGVAPFDHVGQCHDAVAITRADIIEMHIVGKKTGNDRRIHRVCGASLPKR
jgi:hypothetical protein